MSSPSSLSCRELLALACLCSVTVAITPLHFLCLSACQLKPVLCLFSLLDESDYQTEYEEEVLDNQKDDYLDFISNQVEEDSDSVRTVLEQAVAGHCRVV